MKLGKNKEIIGLSKDRVYILKLKYSEYSKHVEEIKTYLEDVERVYGVVILPFYVRDVNKSLQFESIIEK